MLKIDADRCHDNLISEMKPKLSFNSSVDFAVQRENIKDKLFELLGMDKIRENSCGEHFIIEKEEEKDGYRLIRFVYESERDMFIPAYLLIPMGEQKKYPVAITLQGHKSGGMYNSVGVTKNADDEQYQPRGAFALQAIKNGYAALCIELRGMSGELQPQKKYSDGFCKLTAFRAMMLGRTLLGERCHDISKAIDLLHNFPELDTDSIIITGNSGGGTVSFYSACLDERIKLSVPSCAFCTYKDSVLKLGHCACNYIPHALEWFEMQDLSILIAPRKLLIISGKDDDIFPLDGVKRGFETVKEIYTAADAENNCKHVVTPMHHYWCEDIVWSEINTVIKNS